MSVLILKNVFGELGESVSHTLPFPRGLFRFFHALRPPPRSPYPCRAATLLPSPGHTLRPSYPVRTATLLPSPGYTPRSPLRCPYRYSPPVLRPPPRPPCPCRAATLLPSSAPRLAPLTLAALLFSSRPPATLPAPLALSVPLLSSRPPATLSVPLTLVMPPSSARPHIIHSPVLSLHSVPFHDPPPAHQPVCLTPLNECTTNTKNRNGQGGGISGFLSSSGRGRNNLRWRWYLCPSQFHPGNVHRVTIHLFLPRRSFSLFHSSTNPSCPPSLQHHQPQILITCSKGRYPFPGVPERHTTSSP